MTITVFLVDDHEVVRRGLRDLLESSDGIEVVGEAATAVAAMARIPVLSPDIMILDARLPDGSGIEVCRHVRALAPAIKAIILTSYDDDQALFASIIAGASGYLLKEVTGRDLVTAVRDVAAGGALMDPRVTHRIMDRIREGGNGGPVELRELTSQERRVLDLLAEGLTNRQIAERVCLAEKTVKNYVSSILGKLGLERRTQAALLVARVHAESSLAEREGQ